jgi:hypothetical protein
MSRHLSGAMVLASLLAAACGGKQSSPGPAWPESAGTVIPDDYKEDGGESIDPKVAASASIEASSKPEPEKTDDKKTDDKKADDKKADDKKADDKKADDKPSEPTSSTPPSPPVLEEIVIEIND